MGRMARIRWILLVALSFWLAPCGAQEFVDDALRPLFHAALLARQARSVCAEVDPSLGAGIETGLAHLLERHGADLAAGRAAAERRVGAGGIEGLARTLARRFGERLQRQDEPGRRTECATLAAWLETSASRSRRALVEESFRKWFAQQQQARQIECGKLDGTARALSRRLLDGLDPGGAAAPSSPDLLRADAKMAEYAAGWCLQVQGTAAREGIRVAGDFARVRETAHAISQAAMPQLSGGDPAAVVRQGRESALHYLAEPDWI
jgi:hypothetical protein